MKIAILGDMITSTRSGNYARRAAVNGPLR